MKRIYEQAIKNHFDNYNQMMFLMGPRQCGKTTIAKHVQTFYPESLYINYDNIRDRQMILKGQHFIEDIFPLNQVRAQKPLVIFDEIHKYKDFKNYLKGFYDHYKDFCHILVTGSHRLDIYTSDGDSLMGRYFLYRIHPLSARECINPIIEKTLITPPSFISLEDLYTYGGFPDPFIKQDTKFLKRWHALKNQQLFQEDIVQLSSIQEIHQLEVLGEFLRQNAGQLINYSRLGAKIQITTQTIIRWITVLERFYYCFLIRPWHTNIARSLIKEPKVFLWDWSCIDDPGQRIENFVACHLLKFVHFGTDDGDANYGLYFLRDKEQREVDFLITKDNQPFCLIEVKKRDTKLSPALQYFYDVLNPPYGFQVVYDLPHVDKNLFEKEGLHIVPLCTFLSQLM